MDKETFDQASTHNIADTPERRELHKAILIYAIGFFFAFLAAVLLY